MVRRLARFVRRLFGSPDSDGNDEDGSVWNLIPDWQYVGRHARSGGLARDEQERALREVRDAAAEHERESGRR